MILSIIWYGPFWSGCNFLETPFCVVNFGIKTNSAIFQYVADVKRELIWLFRFCLCNNFFVFFFDKFHCVFSSLCISI